MSDFPHRFSNWVRWCRAQSRYHSKAGSIEGQYRSPQIWDVVEPKGDPVDVVDAVFMNRVFMSLPERPRLVIKILHFKTHWRVEWQAQKLNCHHLSLNAQNNWALTAFRLRLADLEMGIAA